MMAGRALPSEKVWAWGAAPEKAPSRGLAGGRLLMPGLARGGAPVKEPTKGGQTAVVSKAALTCTTCVQSAFIVAPSRFPLNVERFARQVWPPYRSQTCMVPVHIGKGGETRPSTQHIFSTGKDIPLYMTCIIELNVLVFCCRARRQ